METNFNFKSSVCTDKNQSERLLALGLRKETVDMYLCPSVDGTIYQVVQLPDSSFAEDEIPAWSLHRLLCLYGLDYTIKEIYNNAEECYGMLICAIEIAIENGYFNKEYLV